MTEKNGINMLFAPQEEEKKKLNGLGLRDILSRVLAGRKKDASKPAKIETPPTPDAASNYDSLLKYTPEEVLAELQASGFSIAGKMTEAPTSSETKREVPLFIQGYNLKLNEARTIRLMAIYLWPDSRNSSLNGRQALIRETIYGNGSSGQSTFEILSSFPTDSPESSLEDISKAVVSVYKTTEGLDAEPDEDLRQSKIEEIIVKLKNAFRDLNNLSVENFPKDSAANEKEIAQTFKNLMAELGVTTLEKQEAQEVVTAEAPPKIPKLDSLLPTAMRGIEYSPEEIEELMKQPTFELLGYEPGGDRQRNQPVIIFGFNHKSGENTVRWYARYHPTHTGDPYGAGKFDVVRTEISSSGDQTESLEHRFEVGLFNISTVKAAVTQLLEFQRLYLEQQDNVEEIASQNPSELLGRVVKYPYTSISDKMFMQTRDNNQP